MLLWPASNLIRRERILLRAKIDHLKEEAAKAFNAAKGALNEVIDTSNSWALKAFEMLAEPEEVPRFECRLNFHESLHKVMVIAEEPPVFLDSSVEDADNDEESQSIYER